MPHLIRLASICLWVALYSGTALADSFGGGGGSSVTQSGTWTLQPGNTANTTPWLATINQGGNSAAVKAASTAAATTDPSFVVAQSPNSPPPLTADAIITGTLTTAPNTVTIATNGTATVTISAVLSGTTPSDTFSIQGQMPDASWVTINAYPVPPSSNGAPAAQPISQAAAGSGEWVVPAAGFSHLRLNLTAISGTTPSLAVSFEASQAASVPNADAIITGVNSAATPVAMQTCQQYAYFDGTAALSGANAFTPAVSAASGHVIHICGYSVASGATATNVGLDTAPATCGTTNTKLTPYWQLSANGGKVVSNAFWEGLQSPSTGVVLCLNASAANAVQAEVWYSVY